MNYQLTITGDNAEELLDVMQTLKEGRNTTIVSRPVKTTKKEDPALPETQEDNGAAGEEKTFTLEEVRKAAVEKVNGDAAMKEKVKALLKTYGADSVKVLEATHFGAFMTGLKALK